VGEGGDGPFPIQVGRGPRAVEGLLLAELAPLLEAARRDPSLLRLPVRVVVPSRSLRAHLCALLVRHFGGAVAGVLVQTLHALALEIAERGGAAPTASDALFPVLVRQHARREPPLCERLDALIDGYALVAGDVADLLDAGFGPEDVEPIDDALVELARFPALLDRARALVRVAAGVRSAMEALGIGHRARLVEGALDRLAANAQQVLPARAVFVHGFAEATGLRAELLEALARRCGARFFLDEPPEPGGDPHAEVRWPFSARLRQRLEGVAPAAVGGVAAPPRIQAIEARGAHAEIRAVAERIRARLDAGEPAEGLALVSRDLAGYRTAIRQHFDRLGIPFSGVGESGSVGAVRRRVQALLELLSAGGGVPADRWLDASAPLGPDEDSEARADLRLGLRHVGAVRLGDVAGLRPGPGDLLLPAVGSWRDEADGDGTPRAGRRVLGAGDLARAVAAAGRVQAQLERLWGETRLGSRLERLRELLCEALRWRSDLAECAPVLVCLDALGADLPAAFEIGADDFRLLLRRVFEEVGRQPIGGLGGGVQVLNVMEARSRTFAALFLVGLNRDVFPRSVPPDPLLPDRVRRQLSVLLPDLPIKATGYDEDRYLFAQLLSSSPDVTVSWQAVTDDGKDCPRSTFVERLRWSTGDFASVGAASLLGPPRPSDASGQARRAATVYEAAIRAGLHAGAAQFEDALGIACQELDFELQATLPRVGFPGSKSGRLAVLREFEATAERREVLGPYFGFTGARPAGGDPRSAALYVTTVENVARCPWQTFLSRLLKLEAPPDPLEALPGSDPRLLGTVVHAVLEEIVRDALGPGPDTLEAARRRPPAPVAWPEPAELAERIHSAAARVLAAEGIALAGLARILAQQVAPFLERARELDWADGVARGVVAAELDAAIARTDASGGPREIRFRADRVDAVGGELVLTDYKTGRPISDAVKAATRAGHLLASVARGANLQAVAYALAAGGPGGTGRFLFLGEDVLRDAAVVPVRANQEDLVDAFDAALAAVTRAWDVGAFVPRLTTDGFARDNASCDRCELAIACLRRDSASRGRLQRWIEAQGPDASAASAPERALLAVWRLGDPKSSPSDSGGR